MRTIEECINDIKRLYPHYMDEGFVKRLNEILEIHKAEKGQSLDSCKDVISRIAALEVLKNLYHTLSGSSPEYPEVTINRALERIKILPSVNQARRKGEWIDEGLYADYHPQSVYRCSRCRGHIIEIEPDDFCKFCGADMREE